MPSGHCRDGSAAFEKPSQGGSSIAGLLAGTHRAAHPDYEPDLNFKKAKAEAHGDQPELL